MKTSIYVVSIAQVLLAGVMIGISIESPNSPGFIYSTIAMLNLYLGGRDLGLKD